MAIKHYPNPFEPMTPALAWVAGLYFADGCIYAHYDYRALLHQKDRELLENVKRLIAPSDDPDRVKLQGQRGNVSKGAFSDSMIYHLCIYSKQFYGYLRDLGLTPRKSLTMEWPPWITDGLLPSFVRGLMDGDGTIGRYGEPKSVRVCFYSASEAFIVAFRDAIAPIVGTTLRIWHPSAKKTYRVLAYTRAAIRWCDWMYAGSTVETRLRRKYERYVEARKLRVQKGLNDPL